MSPKNNIHSQHLLTLIGQQVIYHQQQCVIIEVLDDKELVLQALDQDQNIQANQYGEGHRNVPVIYTLPAFDAEGNLHAELIAAGLADLLSQQASDLD
ncbi:hypothetical protein LCGC14_0753220 [marine sediment metagenome]|uniref:Uncharacterized protein n=1 Tax=marine sediment metagenome TaxID=412755 RepID=A0A0F9QN81_9ZZZZ